MYNNNIADLRKKGRFIKFNFACYYKKFNVSDYIRKMLKNRNKLSLSLTVSPS